MRTILASNSLSTRRPDNHFSKLLCQFPAIEFLLLHTLAGKGVTAPHTSQKQGGQGQRQGRTFFLFTLSGLLRRLALFIRVRIRSVLVFIAAVLPVATPHTKHTGARSANGTARVDAIGVKATSVSGAIKHQIHQ